MTKVTVRISLLFGLLLAAFVAASPFYPIDHAAWINNGFVVASLGVIAFGLRELPSRRS